MKSSAQLRETEEFLHIQFPLTRAMGIRVVRHPTGFAVEAPVALNYNHLHTAFGGSINSVATLAGYTFLWMELRHAAAHLVILESSIRFVRPIRERIQAFCIEPEPEQLAAFGAALRRQGKARIKLDVRVEEDGELTARFAATFVAMTNSDARGPSASPA